MGNGKLTKRQHKGQRKLEKIAAREAKFARKESRSRFKRYSIAIVGGLATLACIGEVVHWRHNKPQEVVIPAEISFEQAVANESYRQNYLEQLVEKEIKVTEDWVCFAKLVYDPDLKQLESINGKGKSNKIGYTGERTSEGYHYDILAATDVKKERVKPICYVSKQSFSREFVHSEDELKSLLDNESFHAFQGWKKDIPLKDFKGLTGNESKEVLKMTVELISFDHQLSYIVSGKRQVRQEFTNMLKRDYLMLRKRFEEISKQDNDDALFVQSILKSMKVGVRYMGD